MRNILAIAGKELALYFSSPWSYFITAIFLAVAGYGFGWSSITYFESSIQGFLGWASFFMLFMGPALTMRLISEEEKLGTLELLLTAPVRDFEVALGKYAASVCMFGMMLLLTLYFPLLLSLFGDPDWGPVFSGYLGLFLLGSIYLSIGLFASSLTPNQIAAYVIGSGIIILLWFSGRTSSGMVGENAVSFLRAFSISTYFPAFGRGIIDTNAVIYYLSIIGIFLFLTIRSLESRRWR